MQRVEWKAFHHSIRHDARAFRDSHGGFPCFTRRLVHNGELPAVRVGRSFRVQEKDVDEYLRKSFYSAG